MSLDTTTNWIVINVNLVFLNCVLQVVYELKIADAIYVGTLQLLKGGPGVFSPGKFWNLESLKCDFPHSEATFTTNYAKRYAIHIWY